MTSHSKGDTMVLGSVLVQVRGPSGRNIISSQRPLRSLGLSRSSVQRMATKSAEVLAAGLDELAAHSVQSMMFVEEEEPDAGN